MIWLLLLILPYSAIILLAWFNLRKIAGEVQSVNIESNGLPGVSVIIAAKNEEANLPSLIKELQKLDYPTEKLEIFIVDDNSGDSSAQIIKQASGIKYLLSPGKGKKQAIATALQQAGGELILTSDADCSIPRGWIKAHANKFINESADLLIGQVNTLPGKGLIKLFSDLEFYSLQALSGGLAMAGLPVMCNGANLGFRKEAVPKYPEAVKADLASGDDMFLLHYMKKKKKKICWLKNKNGIVESRMPNRPGSFLKQRSRWAGKAVFYRDLDTIVLTLATLMGNLTLLVSIILLFINTSFLLLAVISYMLKTIPEILLLAKYLKKPGELQKLLAFIPLSLVYPLYILIIAPLSPFSSRKW